MKPLGDSRQVRDAGDMVGNWRGVLYPAGLPTFHRLPAPDRVAHLVRWFWIPEWHIAAGRVVRQQIIGFPACNVVVEPEVVGLAGPTTRASHRDLTGTGWAVGALLRPAATPGLVEPLVGSPGALLDDYRTVQLPELHASILATMTADADAARRRADAVEVYTEWLSATAPPAGEEALLANAMADLVDSDSTVVRVDQAADALGVSVRTLQRLTRRYVGVSPAAMIRRRRLQESAERLRDDPDADIAAIAADLGYADHAHLSTDFRTVLGTTPATYRRAGARSARPGT